MLVLQSCGVAWLKRRQAMHLIVASLWNIIRASPGDMRLILTIDLERRFTRWTPGSFATFRPANVTF